MTTKSPGRMVVLDGIRRYLYFVESIRCPIEGSNRFISSSFPSSLGRNGDCDACCVGLVVDDVIDDDPWKNS